MNKEAIMEMRKLLNLCWAMVIVIFCLGSALLLAGCGQKKISEDHVGGARYKLRFATALPEGHPMTQTAHIYAEKVRERSKGLVEIAVFTNGGLGQEREIIERMKVGTIDMANVNSGIMVSLVPKWTLLTLPYVFESEEHMYKVTNGSVGQGLMEDLESVGFKGMTFYWIGFRSVMLKNGPIYTPDDLIGQKIRTLPSKTMVESVNMMGATAKQMDQDAVYNALKGGVIDGWENNPDTAISYKMYEVCPFYSKTKHFATPNVLMMNIKSWERLPEEIQRLLMEEAIASQRYESEIYKKSEDEALAKLTNLGMKFNDVDIQSFKTKTKPIWTFSEDEIGKEVLEKIEKMASTSEDR